MRGTGRVFQRGSRWWVAYWGFKPNGDTGEVRESGGDTEEKANDLLRRRIREVANHRDGIQKFRGPNQERVTVGELLDNLVADYRQREIKSLQQTVGLDGKGGHLKPIREHFQHFRAVAVTTDRVRRYISDRQAKKISNAKVNRETEILGRAYKLAIEDGKLSYFPRIPALPENNARQGFFERSEFESVVKHLSEPLAEMARFAYGTGWWRGEVSTLRWEHVDRAAQEVRIPTSKSGEPRSVPLDETLRELMNRRWTAREFGSRPGEVGLSAYVFHRDGKPLINFGKAWRAACKKAGLPGKLFHDLRRTAVRDMIRAGVPQAVAKKISGHETDSVFERYNIVSEEDKLDALRRRRSYLETRDTKPTVVALRIVNSDKDSDNR
ncbi:MAG: site-specific integrase [Acidobacteriota bacterium]|nr:site-specific integrase [Acidobacteriota bacterium]